MKEQTMTSIDGELKAKAKEKGLNLSSELEEAIKKKIGDDINSPDDILRCNFCGVISKRQSITDLSKGLVWLIPDEVWCCERCLRGKVKKIIVGATEGI